jgi:hypothetical protein
VDAIGESGLPEAGKPLRRWWRWLAGGVVVLPVALFGLSNLWLASSSGRERVAGLFQRLTGLEARVGPSSWSPWGGVTLRRVELLAPEPLREALGEPLVSVQRVQVRPYWRPLCTGVLMPRSVEVDAPRVCLPVELLSHLASHRPAVVVEVPPGEVVAALAAQGKQAAAGGAAPAAGAAGAAGGASAGATGGEASPPPAAAAAPAAVPGAGPVPAGEARRKTVWVRVRGGSLWLGQVAGQRAWLEAGSVTADVPIGGEAAQGGVWLRDLKLAGTEVAPVEVPVAWEVPVIAAGPWHPVTSGVKSEWSAQLIPGGPLPFLVDVKVPAQEIPRQEWGGAWQVAARQGELVARAVGYLRAPATWQGELRARAARVSGTVPGQDGLAFDETQLWVVVRNGVMTVQDARAVGDTLALLGNAMLFADGRLAANGRLLVPRDTASALQQRFAGILPPAGAGFRPWETPDRWVLDARVGGDLGEPWVEFGEGPTLRVKRLLEEPSSPEPAKE